MSDFSRLAFLRSIALGFFFFIAITCLTAFLIFQNLKPVSVEDFDTYLEQTMKKYSIPGVAIAVVNPDGIVLKITKGYRNLETKAPVTLETLFAIGSATKAFTGVLLAQLYERGLVDFDAPVQNYLPEFRVYDPQVSATLTFRDLMGHWSGIGGHDLAWYRHPKLTSEQLFKSLVYLEPTALPRTKFIYSNWSWFVVASAVAAISNDNWESVLRKEILNPLEMNNSTTSFKDFVENENHAFPYEYNEHAHFQPFQVEPYDPGPLKTVGGLYSNLADMSKWLQFHLNHGASGKNQIISQNALEQTYRPYSMQDPETPYAMGWAIHRIADHTLFMHSGDVLGFSANVSWSPDKNLGVVVLTNQSAFESVVIARQLWQHLLDQHSFSDLAKKFHERGERLLALGKKNFGDPEIAIIQRSLNDFSGSYCHPAYGIARVTIDHSEKALGKDGDLRVEMNSVHARLFPQSESQFFIRGFFSAMKFINFETDASRDHHAQRLLWALEPSTTKPILFERCKEVQ